MADDVIEGGSQTTSSDNYNPFLPKLLGIDPNAVRSGQISLSTLGRQALGADSPEYQQAQKQVEAAQAQLDKALQSRQGGLDPKMLALAAGLFKPGGGGFFGGLSEGLQGYSAAANEQAKQDQEIAKMRLALAQQAQQQQQQFAQMGLKVAGSLAPKMTAIQQQLISEGIDPQSPQGLAEAAKRGALKEATPDMKTFAAQSGLSLTDPTFSAKFAAYNETKPLQETAARLGLDLNNPEHLGIARREFNRSKTLTEVSPELKKYLESFAGDVTNPKDMAKAALLLAQSQGLDVESKKAQIMSSKASTQASLASIQRTLQEISENARNGGTDAAANTAKQNGVPTPDTSRYAGLTPKEAAAQRVKDMDSTREYIEKNVAPGMNKVQDDIDLLNQAKGIIKNLPTGTIKAQSEWYRNYLSGRAADYQVLDKLSNRTLSGLKIEGDHNISNADRDFMKSSTFSFKNVPEANNKIIDGMLAQRQRDKEYQDFVLKFAQAGGTVPEANQKFQQYANANPIMVKDKAGNWVENKNRMTYSQYFTAPRKNYDKNGNPLP